jgi:type IV pilus assembly protein PilN
MNQMMDAQRDRNNLLRSEITVLDKQIEEINSLEQQKQQHIARIQIIESLQISRSEIVRVFDAFPKLIPDGVYLTSLQQAGNRFTMQGLTQSPTRVSTFIRSIDGSGLIAYDGIGPIAAGRDTGASSNFTIYARLASAQPAAAT